MAVSQKIKGRITIEPSSSTPRCIPKRTEEMYSHRCMFIAALFIKAKRWKQLKYLSTDEWINKM